MDEHDAAGGLAEQWRDMARSTESMRQMMHDPALLDGVDPIQRENLKRAYQFPELGGTLFKFIQPGLEVIK
jgi:hypothetical protein